MRWPQWEKVIARHRDAVPAPSPGRSARRPTLAFVSPLPPDRSGIADYTADLLPALADHYDITLVSRGHAAFWRGDGAVMTVRTPEWLRG